MKPKTLLITLLLIACAIGFYWAWAKQAHNEAVPSNAVTQPTSTQATTVAEAPQTAIEDAQENTEVPQAVAKTPKTDDASLKEIKTELKPLAQLTLEDWALQPSQGNAPQTLAQLMGAKGLLVDFWAFWCGPCIRSMPDLIEEAKVLPKQGVNVIAVHIDDINEAEKLRNKWEIDFPWMADTQLADHLQVEYIPYKVIILPDGRVFKQESGSEHAIHDLLKEIDAVS